MKKRRPTFEQLREKRKLRVSNPDNGIRFVVSLRDWESVLWFVRVFPENRKRVRGTPFTTAHRLMSRTNIEDWLSRLELV